MTAKPPKTWGIVRVFRPAGCDKTDLSLNALDSWTRELAQHTFIAFNDALISCTAIAVKDGNLVLTIPPGSFEFVEVKT